jgi:DNA-binding transcriptional MocR family regulator
MSKSSATLANDGRIISAERRNAIAKIIRTADGSLIEDDAYGLLEPSVSPIANLLPERTYLASTFSKCVAPALRVAYLLTPDSSTQMRPCLQTALQMTAPFTLWRRIARRASPAPDGLAKSGCPSRNARVVLLDRGNSKGLA